MISALDRLLAVSSSMACALYVMAASVLWFMVLFQRSQKSGVIYDRAAAWSAFAVIFAFIAAIRLGYTAWKDVAAVFIVCAAVVTATGLYSVYQITKEKLGAVPLYVFSFVVVVTGSIIWLWG